MPFSFSSYSAYVTQLRRLSSGQRFADDTQRRNSFEAALNGEARRELERLVPIASRRWGGSFFTNTELADVLARRLRESSKSLITDPTVGAGDLLLAAARSRPLRGTVEATIDEWSEIFAGVDREKTFVQAARLRLWLLAHVRHNLAVNELPGRNCLTQLSRADVFESEELVERADEILINPPFSRIRAPAWYEHAQGKVNAAAVITEFTVRHLRDDARVHAILPEVLRTGTSYDKWRSVISGLCEVSNVVSCGQFATADVDVFLVTLRRRRVALNFGAQSWYPKKRAPKARLGSIFAVSVGPVVDYRDSHTGPWRAFAHPKNLTPWAEVQRIPERRRFEGTALKPPLVVIRRTSSPRDNWRASASIVIGTRVVAIENHLIVCRPLRGGLPACRQLLRQLHTQATNDFLNREMRCRHLTVEVVRRIPIAIT